AGRPEPLGLVRDQVDDARDRQMVVHARKYTARRQEQPSRSGVSFYSPPSALSTALPHMTRLSISSRRLAALVPLVCALACGEHERPVFKLLDPSETGVTFANTIKTDDSLNVQSDVYVYNGAGVAVGDLDGDGLPDIFFAGNKVTSRLYHNK